MRRLRHALALLAVLTPVAAAAGSLPRWCLPSPIATSPGSAEGSLDFISDCDGDGVPDPMDNCGLVPNAPPLDCDSDSDGYGNACDADYNNDFVVGGPDFGAFAGDFGGPESPNYGTDQNCDGVVGGPDFGLYAAGFGGAPGPSGKACAGNHPGGLGVVGSCP